MQSAQFIAFFLLILGAAIGSFLAAWGDRMARGRSILWGRSRCDLCAAPIRLRDMVPILSWLWLGARCRDCGETLPRRLFLAEVGGVMLAAIAVWLAQSPLHMILGALWLWLLLGLLLCDLSAFRLPDALTGLLFGSGLALAWEDPARDIGDAFIGAGLGAGAFWALRVGYSAFRGREGLGLGDVKLIAGIGAGLGAVALPVVSLVAAVLALLWTGAKALRDRERPNRNLQIPFGAYLAAAAALVWAWQLI